MNYETTMEVVNKWITERAERRLNKDIADLCEYVNRHPLLSGTESLKLGIIKETGKDGKLTEHITGRTSLCKLLAVPNSELCREIKAIMLPVYIERDAKQLHDTLNSLHNKISEIEVALDEVKRVM